MPKSTNNDSFLQLISTFEIDAQKLVSSKLLSLAYLKKILVKSHLKRDYLQTETLFNLVYWVFSYKYLNWDLLSIASYFVQIFRQAWTFS